MSTPTQELMRTTPSRTTQHSSEATKKPSQEFRRSLRVSRVDPDPKHPNLFELIDEQKEEEALDGPAFTPSVASSVHPLPLASELCGASPLLQPVFEKMASCMIIMDLSGETHTTLYLDQPQFAQSPFFGTQITIKEFTTAPKAFNIEIISNPAALSMIQSHQSGLLCLFAQGKFPFTIHRLDTALSSSEERPVFHRHEQTQQEGDHP